MLESGRVSPNSSPGAAKRGASGSMTSEGQTLHCTDDAPSADAEYATALARTSPTNSGSEKTTSATPSLTSASRFHSASGLNRRVGTGLTLPSISAP